MQAGPLRKLILKFIEILDIYECRIQENNIKFTQ